MISFSKSIQTISSPLFLIVYTKEREHSSPILSCHRTHLKDAKTKCTYNETHCCSIKQTKLRDKYFFYTHRCEIHNLRIIRLQR